MSMEQFYSEQAAQMYLSGIEFIALFSFFTSAGALLIWSGIASWIGVNLRRIGLTSCLMRQAFSPKANFATQ
jgi:hypothetical protein